MITEVIISPEELYYIAKKIDGKYIDYDYIASMEDIGQQKLLYEQTCRKTLGEKGLLEEDFSGEETFSSAVEDLVEPLFNGDYESVWSYYDGGEETVEFRLHRMNDRYIRSSRTGGGYLLKKVNDVMINECLKKWLHVNTLQTEGPEEIDKESITGVIVLKGMLPEKWSVVNVFYEYGNSLYEEQEEGGFRKIAPELFKEHALKILKGE